MRKMSITLTEGEIGLICDLLENQAENHDEWGEKHNAEWVRGLIENIRQQQKNSTMETSLVAINKWAYFCLNFPSDFIEKVWEDNSSLANHFKNKFEWYYDRYHAMGCILAFYAELDGDNKQKLMRWVMQNFNDEQKLNFKNK